MSSRSSRTLPFLRGLPTKDRQLAEKGISQQDDRRRRDNDARGRRAEAAAEAARRQLHDLLGKRRLAELNEGLARERLAFRDLWDPPGGLKRIYNNEQKASRRRFAALLRKVGANAAKVRKITAEFGSSVEGALTPVKERVVPGYNLSKNLGEWKKLSPFHDHAIPWGDLVLTDDPGGWVVFQPPFFGFLFDLETVATGNFVSDNLHILTPPAGLVGNEATMDCNDAGEFDVASVDARSQVAFRFDAPSTGLIEVLIDAQTVERTHEISIEDEFGFSNAWTSQINFLMMNVLHPAIPDPSFAQMTGIFVDSGGDDKSVVRENLTQGQHFFAHLFSSGPVQAGESVIVTVGTRAFDMARANDMELHSRSHFEWLISSVEVRVFPGGGTLPD